MDIKELLRRATAEARKEQYVSPSDCIETIIMLRHKKYFTWADITEWFNRQDFDFSTGQLRYAYFNHYRIEPPEIKEVYND